MAFWDDSYQSEVNKISSFLERKLSYLSDGTETKNAESDTLFFDQTTFEAWDYFENLFRENRKALNENTKFNQKYLQNRARVDLSLYREAPFQFLSTLLRVLYEYNFWNYDSNSNPQFLTSETFYKLDSINSGEHSGVQFKWIERSMSAAILRDIVTSEDFSDIRKIAGSVDSFKVEISNHIKTSTTAFENKFKDIEDVIHTSVENSLNLKDDLKKYESKLEGYKNEYNFTLLSKAFNSLKSLKKSELKTTRKITWSFSAALVLIPILSFMNHIYGWVVVNKDFTSLTYYLPILTIEILMFYFMRLYYGEIRLLNTQLLQIEHRLSLCEFIQDYIEKKNTDKDNKQSWDLFESLVFSPIQATPDNIPSVLDGANAVAELAGKVMSKTRNPQNP